MGIAWAVVLGLAAAILVALAVYVWRHRTVPGALSFNLLLLAIAGYSLTYALELLGRDLPTKLLWIGAEYPFIVATPVLWLIFAVQYTGKGRWLSRRNTMLLSVVPSVTILTVWTNQAHHLYYSFTGIQEIGSWTLLQVEYGPWFWVHITFSYLCLLAGTLLLADAFLRATPLYRGQATMLLLGALIPWLGNFLYLTRATPWPNLDLTPLAFTLTALVVAHGLFRHRLLQVVPVARRAAVEGMPAAMIVLDPEGRIADLNPAARRLFNLADREAIGQPAGQVLGPAEVVTRFAGVTQADTELEWGEADRRRVYRVTISPLGDQAAGAPARLVLVSDITARAKARDALEQTNRRLQALQESTAALTALLDPAGLFERVMEQVETFMPSRYAALSLWDEAADRLTMVAHRGFSLEEAAEAEQLPDWVVRHQTPLLVENAEPDLQAQPGEDRRSRSLLIVPILYQERCLGVLSLGSPEPAAYSPADRDLLLAFARQVAVAMENARLHEETRGLANRLRVLYEVSTAAATATSLEETLQRTVQALQQTMRADNVALLLLEPEAGELVIRAWAGFPGGPSLMRRQVGVGVPGRVVQTGQAALISNVQQDPGYVACDEETRAELCVPLQLGQRVIGALNLESRQIGAFTDRDLRLLTTLAGHLAAIIENARLGEEAKAKAEILAQRNRHLTLLHEIARVASSTLDLPALSQILADTLAQIIGGDGCYITHVDETTGQVLGSAAYGPFRNSYRGIRPPPGELTLTESVLKAGRPLAVDDVFHSPYMSPRIAEMFPARSQLGLPLRVGERNLGAVLIAFNEPHIFSEEEMAWASQAVDLAALALENAQLFQSVEQSKRDWEATFDAMPDLITILNKEYRIVRANKAMADKLGIAPAEAVGLICYQCVHGLQQPPPFCPHVRLLADDQQHTEEVHEERMGGDFLVSVSPIHDASGRLAGAVHVARDITERKRAEVERERLILELQDALAKVKTLTGLLPICANCKKIRDDQGYWHSVEVYVRDHSEARFSHGICPDCMKELYPWFEGGEP